MIALEKSGAITPSGTIASVDEQHFMPYALPLVDWTLRRFLCAFSVSLASFYASYHSLRKTDLHVHRISISKKWGQHEGKAGS
jgi:hypothetical protein